MCSFSKNTKVDNQGGQGHRHCDLGALRLAGRLCRPHRPEEQEAAARKIRHHRRNGAAVRAPGHSGDRGPGFAGRAQGLPGAQDPESERPCQATGGQGARLPQGLLRGRAHRGRVRRQEGPGRQEDHPG